MASPITAESTHRTRQNCVYLFIFLNSCACSRIRDSSRDSGVCMQQARK